jgi:hypothetical protein
MLVLSLVGVFQASRDENWYAKNVGLLLFVTGTDIDYATVAKPYSDPNMPKNMIERNMFSHLTMGGPKRPAAATAAPHLRRYTAEVYNPIKRVVDAFHDTSRDGGNIAVFDVFVNC